MRVFTSAQVRNVAHHAIQCSTEQNLVFLETDSVSPFRFTQRFSAAHIIHGYADEQFSPAAHLVLAQKVALLLESHRGRMSLPCTASSSLQGGQRAATRVSAVQADLKLDFRL
jgi:hypothetical protein